MLDYIKREYPRVLDLLVNSGDDSDIICRTIINRSYYYAFNYMIFSSKHLKVSISNSGVGASHINSIDSFCNQLKEKYPDDRGLINLIQNNLKNLSFNRQNSDYHKNIRNYDTHINAKGSKATYDNAEDIVRRIDILLEKSS